METSLCQNGKGFYILKNTLTLFYHFYVGKSALNFRSGFQRKKRIKVRMEGLDSTL